ncbi:FkbM family methyltransferase [Roseibium aggregatum]|uniref:FkbM family methyltransferase n=1 Tax=Roseibium aggregatum TaxID=187304 RepID=A0A939J1E6_9HYPH|nr:FkbM family methyltransferase [Roseibium aggregatum]MBN9672056.1 FkbM family methyltransferase [Roseibium aggregatum]
MNGLKLISDYRRTPKDICKFLFDDSYEKPERMLVRQYLDKNDRVLEIGAGIGLVSMVCARIVGEENILSYEPNPRSQKLIAENFALNGMKPRLRGKALALKSGTTTFYFNDNIISSSLIDRKFGGGTSVECDAFADVLQSFRPNVIVMDIEGAEVELLCSADLAPVGKIFVETHPHVVGEEKIGEMTSRLRTSGFSLIEATEDCHLYARECGRPS